uniref:Uncharacterized protein n=1 Tax=Anguilla anguilla TaxID=7936 RepID=A0A0E9SY11_ANGAN
MQHQWQTAVENFGITSQCIMQITDKLSIRKNKFKQPLSFNAPLVNHTQATCAYV